MKIVIVSRHFSEKMGYAENALPRALAKQGADVHVVTSELQPNFPNYEITYEPFLGPKTQPLGSKEIDGFTLHRLQSRGIRSRQYIKGLYQKLNELRPDIVQCLTQRDLSTYQCAAAKLRLGFQLFLEEHTHLSVFSPPTHLHKRFSMALYRNTIARILSRLTVLNYPIGPDVARISTQYFGFDPEKIKIYSMGTDSTIFHPVESVDQRNRREQTRKAFNFEEDSIVCVYSGRFHEGKNPQCLANAIERIRAADKRFVGLFIGAGTQEEEAGIKKIDGCIVQPFVDSRKLGDLYRAADIGVWPKQESLSQLDAAACGLPIIISDKVELRERIEDNGLAYIEGDVDDMADKIVSLNDATTRREMGARGARRILSKYSWDQVAAERLLDYSKAVGHLQGSQA